MALFPIAGAAKARSPKKASLPAQGSTPSVATASQTVNKPKGGGAMSMPPALSPDYRAESDYRTLSDADDIKSDSGRFTAARAHASKQITKARNLFGGRR